MRTLILTSFLVVTLSTLTYAQHSGHATAPKTAQKPATLVAGMGSHHHPVSTNSPEAQKFFDQGLSFLYAFNHDEAIRSFKRAAEIDPQLAMAYWGIALSLGANINLGIDPERAKAAYEAVQKALALRTKAPENERAYIEALSKRYSGDPNADLKQLATNYKNAMGELVRRYPDDLDLATLYADAAMNLRPWQLWTPDGKPAEGTEEIVAILESVLRRDPDHIGAIHYYVHAIEMSPHPERALAYAPKLTSSAPAAGHLVHMPAHIYQRVGDYHAAAVSNREAAAADEAFFKTHGIQGVYPLMYYSHNLHFEAYAQGMSGRYADALSVARKLETFVRPYTKEMPMAEGFMPTPIVVMVRFNKWNEILALPKPDQSLPATNAFWHFARGIAFSKLNRRQEAVQEQSAFDQARKSVTADAMIGLNSTANVLKVAEHVLAAHVAGDSKTTIDLLQRAVEAEGSLAYDEPPGWFIPVREMLGHALLNGGDYAGAEVVFRSDLERNKRNGRSLFGLREALKAQNKTYAARLVQREFENAWRHADTKLSLEGR